MSQNLKLDCGCRVFKEHPERLAELCAAHNQLWRELHARAIADYRDGHPLEDFQL